jgi:hypothetical protein
MYRVGTERVDSMEQDEKSVGGLGSGGCEFVSLISDGNGLVWEARCEREERGEARPQATKREREAAPPFVPLSVKFH